MADRRSIHRKAAVSEDLAALRDAHGGDALAFALLLIPFYDRFGCVPASPRALRAMVIPNMEDRSSADVSEWLDWMVERDMLTPITGPNGDEGLRNPSFELHQKGAQFVREAASIYEPEAISKALEDPRRKGAKKPTGSRGVGDKSQTRRDQDTTRLPERKGKEVKLSPSPTPSPGRQGATGSPPMPQGAAAPVLSSGENGAGGSGDTAPRANLDEIVAAAPPAIAAAMQRARRSVAGLRGEATGGTVVAMTRAEVTRCEGCGWSVSGGECRRCDGEGGRAGGAEESRRG